MIARLVRLVADRFTYTTLLNHSREVVADQVTFEPAHVVFWRDGRVLMAELNRDVHRLRQRPLGEGGEAGD